MKKEQCFLAFLLFLSVFMLIGQVAAQVKTPTPAVSPGNTFTYDFSVFWSSTDPNAMPPANLVEENKTETIRVTVTEVSGLMVLMNITSHFENGTERTESAMVNILSGEGYRGFGLFVSPKLGANNIVYPYGERAFIINASGTKTYPFGVRETARSSMNSTNSTGYVYAYDDIYFDKETGAMLEWYTETVSESSPNEKTARQWKIKEFDLTTISNPNIDYWMPLIVIAAAAGAVLLVAFVLAKVRRKRRRRRRK